MIAMRSLGVRKGCSPQQKPWNFDNFKAFAASAAAAVYFCCFCWVMRGSFDRQYGHLRCPCASNSVMVVGINLPQCGHFRPGIDSTPPLSSNLPPETLSSSSSLRISLCFRLLFIDTIKKKKRLIALQLHDISSAATIDGLFKGSITYGRKKEKTLKER